MATNPLSMPYTGLPNPGMLTGMPIVPPPGMIIPPPTQPQTSSSSTTVLPPSIPSSSSLPVQLPTIPRPVVPPSSSSTAVISSQSVGAAIQSNLILPNTVQRRTLDTGSALLNTLAAANPDIRRPSRYGPTYAQLRVLSLLDAEPLFLNPAASGQFASKAAAKVKADIEAIELAARARDAASTKINELSTNEPTVSNAASDYLLRELEIRRASDAFVHAEMKVIEAARKAITVHNGANPVASTAAYEAYVHFVNSQNEASIRQKESNTAISLFTSLNENHRVHYSRYNRNWRDASVTSPSGCGLAYRLRMAAHASGALLFPQDTIGSIDPTTGITSTGTLASIPTENNWVTAPSVGMRLPTLRDVVPPGVLHKLDNGTVATEALNSTVDNETASVSSSTYSLIAPKYSRAPSAAHNTYGTATAYVHDMVTQMLLHVLPGIIAITKERNKKEVEAIRQAKLTSLPTSNPPVTAVAGHGSPLDEPEVKPGSSPFIPIEVRESADPEVHRTWKDIGQSWRSWYQTERTRTLQSRSSITRASKANFSATGLSTRPDKVYAATFGSSNGPVSPNDLYRRIIIEACHESCRRFYAPPLEKLVDELAVHPDTDPSAYTPEAFATFSDASRKAVALNQQYQNMHAQYRPPVLPGATKDTLTRTIGIRADGTLDVPETGGITTDTVLLLNQGSNARVTVEDVRSYLARQLSGSMPGEDKPTVADIDEYSDDEDYGDEYYDEENIGTMTDGNHRQGGGEQRASDDRGMKLESYYVQYAVPPVASASSSSTVTTPNRPVSASPAELLDDIDTRSDSDHDPKGRTPGTTSGSSTTTKRGGKTASQPSRGGGTTFGGKTATGSSKKRALETDEDDSNDDGGTAPVTTTTTSTSGRGGRGRKAEIAETVTTHATTKAKRGRKSAAASTRIAESMDNDGGDGLDVLSALAGFMTEQGGGNTDSTHTLPYEEPYNLPVNPLAPEKVYKLTEVDQRIQSLRSLAPNICQHPRAAAWLRWGVAHSVAKSIVTSECGPHVSTAMRYVPHP